MLLQAQRAATRRASPSSFGDPSGITALVRELTATFLNPQNDLPYDHEPIYFIYHCGDYDCRCKAMGVDCIPYAELGHSVGLRYSIGLRRSAHAIA